MEDSVHYLDYILFAAMLIISTSIGIYHGCTGGKNKNNEEFLMANRSMGIFPATCSMIATYISAILVLGTPAEVFSRGTAYPLWIVLALVFAAIATATIFVPVIFNLKLTSVYEYLEMRFEHQIPRIIGSFLFSVETLLYLGIALYAPATAVEAVMGIDLWISLVCVGGLCTFYTTFGGMKAVMWTDVFQILTVLSGLIAVVTVVSMKFGGFGSLWKYAEEGGRIDFGSANGALTEYTIWSMFLGSWVMWFSRYAANQSGAQRFLTMKTQKEAMIATCINAPGAGFLFILAAMCGIAVFRVYGNCDPILQGVLDNGNQYMPKMIKEVLAIPGLTGLFVATLFAGALSTVSSGLNSTAAVIWTDVIARCCCRNGATAGRAATTTKVLAASFGIFGVLLAFIVKFLGSNVIQATFSVIGITTGPSLGMFLLGLLTSKANWVGASTGAVMALMVTGWLSVGKFISGVKDASLETTLDNCTELVNVTILATTATVATTATTVTNSTTTLSSVPFAYRINYLWWGPLGLGITFIGGYFISTIVHPFVQPSAVDSAYLAPIARLWNRRPRQTEDSDKLEMN